MQRLWQVVGFCATVTMFWGCRGGPEFEFVPVSGTVMLDGKPLDQIRVEFWPVDAKGPTSAGTTDADGKFVLATLDTVTPGAIRGTHKVCLKDNSVFSFPEGKKLTPSEKRGMDITSGKKPRILDTYSQPTQTPLTYSVDGPVDNVEFKPDPYKGP